MKDFKTLESCIVYSLKEALEGILEELEQDLGEDSIIDYSRGFLEGILSFIDIIPYDLEENLNNIIIETMKLEAYTLRGDKDIYISKVRTLIKQLKELEK